MSHSLRTILPAFVLFLCSLCAYTPAKASHASGAELVYEWVSGTTYRFYYKFYRDCSGIKADVNVAMCYHSDCGNDTNSVTLSRVDYLPGGAPNGTPINTECPGFLSTCSSPNGTVPNYEEWWYTNTVTLPYNCNAWHFDVLVSARNTVLNVAGGGLSVSTVMNNADAPGDNSPQFSVKPISFICINEPYTYNNGAIDPDGDSVSFEMVQPMAGGLCEPDPMPFQPGTPAYNLTSNPFQTNNSFSLDPLTGQMSFTPTLQGANVVAVRASEYRNGQFIGSVMRDIQLRVMPCNAQQPVMTILPNTIQNGQQSGGLIYACAGNYLSFCFKLKAATPATVLVASDNHNITAPGSVMTYTGQQTDSVYGCFSWTPGPLDTGMVLLTITAKDSSCVAPGIILAQTFSIPLYISPSTTILRDTTICLNQVVPLHAYGGSQFSWAALPGGSGTASLSCTQCSDPIASPSVTTSYVVTSNLQNVCGKNKDTVTVTVNQQQAPATPVATSNSVVCNNAQLQLGTGSVTGATYEWWGPSGFHATVQNPSISNAQLFHSGLYFVQLSVNGCKSLPGSTPVVVKSRPVVDASNPITFCQADTVTLAAFGSEPGLTYQWTGPQNYTSTDSFAVISPATPANSGLYIVVVNNGCPSIPDSISITIISNQPPVATSPVVYCQYDQAVPLTATGTNLLWHLTMFDLSGTATAPTPNTSSPGTYTWFVESATSCTTDRTQVDVIVKPKPAPPHLAMNTIYCEGVPGTPLTTTGTNVLWYTQPTGGTGSPIAPIPNTNLPGVPQIWYATQTDQGCESDRQAIIFILPPRPALPGTDSVFYCAGTQALPLTAQGQGLTWYTTPVSGAGTTTAPVPATGNPGVQIWYVSQTIDGCEGFRAPLVVTVTKGITADLLLSKDSLCAFDTLTITDATAADPENSYTWSFDSAVVVSGSGNGPYILNWQTAGSKQVILQVSGRGCTAADTAEITVLPVPQNDFDIESDACIGQVVRTQAGWDVPREGLQYTWSFTGANIVSGSGWGFYTLTWDKPGIYPVQLVTDNGQCRSQVFHDTITVHDYPLASIAPTGSGEICSGDPVTLTAAFKNGYHYQWTPAHYFSGKDTATITAAITNTGIIRLQVTDEYGCISSDSVFIRTKPCCMISLPDAFTPNGDGRNDIYRIITIGHHQLSTFRILNRWGQEVFETANEQHGWDGTLGGTPQEMGTYFYYLKYKCADGNITEQTGSFMLIR